MVDGTAAPDAPAVGRSSHFRCTGVTLSSPSSDDGVGLSTAAAGATSAGRRGAKVERFRAPFATVTVTVTEASHVARGSGAAGGRAAAAAEDADARSADSPRQPDPYRRRVVLVAELVQQQVLVRAVHEHV